MKSRSNLVCRCGHGTDAVIEFRVLAGQWSMLAPSHKS